MVGLNKEEKFIDIEYNKILSENEAKQVKDLQQRFINSYINNKDKMEVEEWLAKELKINLPDKSALEIEEISREIINTIKLDEENHRSLDQAIENGKSKESWFSSILKETTSNMATSNMARYLHELDEALKSANQLMYDVIINKRDAVNQNINLQEFIAEQQHANAYNLQAKLKGSKYRAEVLVPKDGNTYHKNSVDLVIKDESGKIVESYQAKYGKTVEDTIKMIKEGNYNNERLLVPTEQVEEVQKVFPNKTVVVSVGSENIKSKPLNYEEVKELQNEAQGRKWDELNWNEYKSEDLAIGIGKQAGYAAIQGAAIGGGIELASKVIKGEEVKGEEVVEKALVSGADFGVKAATAGALKVGVEKGIIEAIPKGTPAETIANIAYVSIENVKVLGKVATGELTIKEGLDKMEETTIATVAGIAASAEGTAIGAIIGSLLGPVGTVVGGFVGGTAGYIAGAKVAETVVKGVQNVRKKAREVVVEAGGTIVSGVKSAYNGVKSFAKSLFSL